MLHCFEARHEQAFIVHNYLCTEYPPNIELREAVKKKTACIFQPLHNEVKSVLGIKESYSMEKRPKILTNSFGQAGGG